MRGAREHHQQDEHDIQRSTDPGHTFLAYVLLSGSGGSFVITTTSLTATEACPSPSKAGSRRCLNWELKSSAD
jgi:hypothetical protein